MKKLLLATSALVAFAAGAQAADLGAPRMPIAAAVVAPAFNWTGFYAGAQVGYGWGRTRYDLDVPPTVGSGVPFNVNGFFGGVHLGYLWQFNQAVLGIETDLELTGARGNDGGFGGTTDTVNRRWQGSTRLIAGVAVDKALFYATGGLAYGDVRYTRPDFNAEAITKTRIGWAVGAGVKYAFTPNLSAGLEYRFSSLPGTQSFLFVAGDQRTLYGISDHSIRVSLSYHFTTGPSAVVARY